jgi:hypothetical protein
MPEIARSGGATVLTSPYGMPMQLLRMDKYQPPTWVVGFGSAYENAIDESAMFDVDSVLRAANQCLTSVVRNSWSAVGFWIVQFPWRETILIVEPVETFTNHYMAIDAAIRRDQEAIYNLATETVEEIPSVIAAHYARDAKAEWLSDAIGE